MPLIARYPFKTLAEAYAFSRGIELVDAGDYEVIGVAEHQEMFNVIVRSEDDEFMYADDDNDIPIMTVELQRLPLLDLREFQDTDFSRVSFATMQEAYAYYGGITLAGNGDYEVIGIGRGAMMTVVLRSDELDWDDSTIEGEYTDFPPVLEMKDLRQSDYYDDDLDEDSDLIIDQALGDDVDTPPESILEDIDDGEAMEPADPNAETRTYTRSRSLK